MLLVGALRLNKLVVKISKERFPLISGIFKTLL